MDLCKMTDVAFLELNLKNPKVLEDEKIIDLYLDYIQLHKQLSTVASEILNKLEAKVAAELALQGEFDFDK